MVFNKILSEGTWETTCPMPQQPNLVKSIEDLEFKAGDPRHGELERGECIGSIVHYS